MRTLVPSLALATVVASVVAVGGCKGGHEATPTPPAAAPAPTPTAPVADATHAATGPALSWIDDDYDKALALAKSTKRPLVIDGWAPWCHTCLSMKSYVLKDPALLALDSRFVWLAIDTEKPKNAPVVAKYPLTAWPTFFIVDPATEQVHGRWVGSSSAAQFRSFLLDGQRTVEMAHAGELPKGDPLAFLVEGNRHAAAKRYAEAAAAYRQALAKAPADWARRPDTLIALLESLTKTSASECVDLALTSIAQTGKTSTAADFAYYALSCADELPKTDPRVAKVQDVAVENMKRVALDPTSPMSADDRGDVLRTIWDVLETKGDAKGAKEMAQRRLEILDQAAASAPDRHAASTFNWARAETYLYLGRGDEAIKMLDQFEKDLPADYNPPHHLARTYLNLKRFDEAVVAIDRAIAKAYGPRQAGMFGLKADILEAAAKPAEARAAVEKQLAAWSALPAAQQRPEAMAKAKERLAKLSGAKPAAAKL